MKRKIVLILALMLMFVSVHSIYADITKMDITFESVQPASQLATLLRSKIGQINDEIALRTSNKGTGDIYYVDSDAASGGAGKSWFGAKTTLNAAVALCDDNNGDIIYIASGHTEELEGADGVKIDKAGITVIGLGNGMDMPEFTYDALDDEFVIGAANVTVINCRFVAGFKNITMAISVEDAGDDFTLYKCVFPKPTTNTFNFADAIDVASGVTDIKIIGCEYYGDEAGGDTDVDHFIDLGNAILDGVLVANCILRSDFEVSAIWSNDADDEVYILNNIITNLTADQHCIEFTANATGVCAYNLLYTSAVGTTLAPGYMKCFENYVTTTDNKSGTIIPVHETGLTQLNATSVAAIYSSLSGLTGYGFLATCDTNTDTATVDCTQLSGFGNDYFNDGWSIVCFMNSDSKGSDPEGEVRDITDYDTDGTFTVAAFSAYVDVSDEILVIRTHHLNPHVPALLGISADIWYCDDGGSNGDGMTWQTAKTTLKAAVALCGEGDTIYVGMNHNETMTDSGSIVLNDKGLTIIGMGEGDARPRLDYDEADSEITISEVGITIKNIRFMPAITEVVAAIVVGSSGIGCLIENCAFVQSVDAAGTDEFIDAITVNAASANLTIKNCTYYNTAASGENDTFVNLAGGTISGTSIIGCTVFGDFAIAPIWSDDALVNVLIKDNVLSNVRSTKYAIQLTGAATGMLVGNRLHSDSFGTMLDPGYLKCIDNWGADAVDQQAIRMPLSGDTSDVVAEDDGGSDIERLEYLQNKSDDALALLRAAGGSVGDVFYLDDSGSSGNDGTSWALAENSLTNGYGDCSAGDILFISPDYTETITSSPLTLATDGVTIIGLGNGDDRPTFTFTATNSSIDVGAADNVFDNLIFLSTTADTTIGIDIADEGDGTVIKNCEFKDTGGNEFLTAIDLKDDADRVTIENCRFIGGVGCVEAIQSTDGTVDRLSIIGNTFYGTYSAAVIHSDQVDLHVLVKDNVITNVSSGVHCIEFTAAAEGELINNLMSGDVYGSILDPGSLRCFRNMQTVGVDSAAEDIPLVVGKTYARSMLFGDLDDSQDLFDVDGGAILITFFVGRCTVSGDSTITRDIMMDSDDSGKDYDFSSAVNIAAVVQGDFIVFDDTLGESVLTIAALGTSGSIGTTFHWLAVEGMIICRDPGTDGGNGNIEWYMTFTPLVNGVEVIPQATNP